MSTPPVFFDQSADLAAVATAAGIERLRALGDDFTRAYAPNTQRAWRADWRAWLAFCAMAMADELGGTLHATSSLHDHGVNGAALGGKDEARGGAAISGHMRSIRPPSGRAGASRVDRVRGLACRRACCSEGRQTRDGAQARDIGPDRAIRAPHASSAMPCAACRRIDDKLRRGDGEVSPESLPL